MGASRAAFSAFDMHNLMLMIKLSRAPNREIAHL